MLHETKSTRTIVFLHKFSVQQLLPCLDNFSSLNIFLSVCESPHLFLLEEGRQTTFYQGHLLPHDRSLQVTKWIFSWHDEWNFHFKVKYLQSQTFSCFPSKKPLFKELWTRCLFHILSVFGQLLPIDMCKACSLVFFKDRIKNWKCVYYSCSSCKLLITNFEWTK